MPASPVTFLVVDDNSDSRFLLVKTIMRKFTGCAVIECDEIEPARAMAAHHRLAAAVVHRAADADGVSVVSALRNEHATLPIVMVSGIDRAAAGRMAGANTFLPYDEWLRIGIVVGELLRQPEKLVSAPEQSASGPSCSVVASATG